MRGSHGRRFDSDRRLHTKLPTSMTSEAQRYQSLGVSRGTSAASHNVAMQGTELVVHAEECGVGHGARDGDVSTLCGRTTSGLRVFDDRPFASAAPDVACPQCAVAVDCQ